MFFKIPFGFGRDPERGRRGGTSWTTDIIYGIKLRLKLRPAGKLSCLPYMVILSDILSIQGNYALNSNNAPTRRSEILSGSCRAISMMLSNFFTPIWSLDDNPSLSEPKPASASILIARLCSCSDGNSSTS